MPRGASAAQAAEALDMDDGALGQRGSLGEHGAERETRPHRT